ncbi:hypothetical protein [Achromobacter kerstersii]
MQVGPRGIARVHWVADDALLCQLVDACQVSVWGAAGVYDRTKKPAIKKMIVLNSPNAGIVLQTAKGQEIPNDQFANVDYAEVANVQLHQKNFGTSLVVRSGPTGIYNCHGLTFASRRAWLSEPHFLSVILKDDSYVQVGREHVLPGDVILYLSEYGEIDHSGIVVELPANNTFWSPRVCSKWGQSAEFLHWAHTTPYGNNWQFWRVKR